MVVSGMGPNHSELLHPAGIRMFLLKDRRYGQDYFVFTYKDPQKEGYNGSVIENVSLDYDMNAIHHWPDGEPSPEPQLGLQPANPKHYKVFKFPDELHRAGYQFVSPNSPIVVNSWLDFRKLVPLPLDVAEELEESEWFDLLDNTDEGMKRRRQKNVDSEPPPGSDRDRIAEWVAKRHMTADGSIRQVYYLPADSPPQEIRLLEINDRFTGSEDKPQPLDFGLEVAGRILKLFIADVSTDQLEKMKRDPSSLPQGWKWDGVRSWGVRA